MHRQHHVGVGADVVGPQDDDASIARGHWGHQGSDQLFGLIKGSHHHGGQAMQGVAQSKAGHEQGQVGEPLPALDGFGRCRGWSPAIQLRHVVAADAALSRLEIRFPPPGVPLRTAPLAPGIGLGGGHKALR